MNKKIIAVVVGFFLIGIVFAVGEVIERNKDITLTGEQKSALENAGFNLQYERTVYDIGTDEKKLCLEGETIHTCETFKTYYINCLGDDPFGECLDQEKVYLTKEEMDTILDDWEEERIKGIANAFMTRQERAEQTLIETGTTTIK